MKAATHYPMMILFLVSLLTGQFGCAHVSQQPNQETWVCSADGPEFDTSHVKGKGFLVAKDFTKGLTADTGTGALIGSLVGVTIGAGVTLVTSGAGVVLLPPGVVEELLGGLDAVLDRLALARAPRRVGAEGPHARGIEVLEDLRDHLLQVERVR